MLIIIALYDFIYYKIPNKFLIIYFFISFINLLYLRNSIINSIITFFIIFILLFSLYFIKILPAGDVKLLSIMSIHLDIEIMKKIVYLTIFLALFEVIFKFLKYKIFLKRMRYFYYYLINLIYTKKIDKYIDDYSGIDNKEKIALAPYFVIAYIYCIYKFNIKILMI